jgi:tetratricopeptide (TPR) repeat protein
MSRKVATVLPVCLAFQLIQVLGFVPSLGAQAEAQKNVEMQALEQTLDKGGGQPAPVLLDQARQLVDQQPQSARARFVLAQALQNAGMFELATDTYRSAKALDVATAQARLEKFHATMNSGDLELAMKQYLEISTNFPEDPSLKNLEEILKARWGTVENGWSWYLQAVAHHQRLKGINGVRGWQLLVEGKYAEALRYAEADAAIDPRDPEFQALTGRCLYHLRRYAEALRPLQKAFFNRPYERGAAGDLTRTYMALGMKEDAFKTSLYYLTIKPEDVQRQELVARLYRMVPDAVRRREIEEGSRAAHFGDRGGDLHIGLARVFQRLGDRKRVLEELTAAVKDQPRNVKAQMEYAREEARLGHYQQALQACEYALLFEPDNRALCLMRDRLHIRMQNQDNDVAGQIKNVLRTGHRVFQ